MKASQAGVKIQLIIRVSVVSNLVFLELENIEVKVSIVGPLLEHLVFHYFHNNGDERIYLSSADVMTRNMIKRVEILFLLKIKPLVSV